jgi:membrane fusion protein, adhesin transport system
MFKFISTFTEFCKSVFLNNKKDTDFDEDNSLTHALENEKKSDLNASKATRIIIITIFFLSIFFLWAYFFKIDEVSKGDGKVIPSSKEQVIQSLDGGILTAMNVKEGDRVQQGQIIATLDQTRSNSNLEESIAKYYSALASQARLYAEVNNSALVFPKELNDFPELRSAETNLFKSRKANFEASIANIRNSRTLIESQLAINERLAIEGAASTVDVINLRKQLVDLNMREADLQKQFVVQSHQDYTRVKGEADTLAPVVKGRKDMVDKSSIKSPVYGIVKDIQVTTVGGVVPPNGTLMNIVPLDDTLLIEARIQPRDVAFIRPGLPAQVKITAYDYTIYGALSGEVTTISPDTIKDEVKPDLVYYRVYIRTDKDYLETDNGKKYFITPGMVATVDIKTGQKTILQYLLKPFNKINEALRER